MSGCEVGERTNEHWGLIQRLRPVDVDTMLQDISAMLVLRTKMTYLPRLLHVL